MELNNQQVDNRQDGVLGNFNKIKTKNLKELIKKESLLQKERKILIKDLIEKRKIDKSINWEILNLQSKIKETSKELTFYYQEYNLARNKDIANKVEKYNEDNLNYRNKIKEFKYKTNILYLDIDSYIIKETEFISENGFRLIETRDINSKEFISNKKILFESKNKEELEIKLEDLNNEIAELDLFKKFKNIREVNIQVEKEEEKELSIYIKEQKKINLKIKEIKSRNILETRKRKDEMIDIIHKIKKIKEEKLEEIKYGRL